MRNISMGLFGTFVRNSGVMRFENFDGTVREIVLTEPPLWLCWGMLFLFSAVCLAVLHWKVKAYEVVK